MTLIHEHLRARDESNAEQFPHLYDDDALRAAAIEAAEGALDRGVKTICEQTAMLLGRDIRFVERVARETGLQVVACTGIYTYDRLPLFWQSRSADVMSDAFVHDIEQGIQGTDIKAAFLKCAADEPGVTESVAPEQIQIAHPGTPTTSTTSSACSRRGCESASTATGSRCICRPSAATRPLWHCLSAATPTGCSSRADSCASLDWFPDETVEQLVAAGAVEDWTITLIHDQVIPALREGGMTDAQLSTMLKDNPRRWLAV